MYYDSAFDPALERHEWECNINGYIALLKLNGNIMEYSSLHTFNDHILTAKSWAAMLIWMQRNNIHEKYDNLDEDCRILENQPIHIQPLTEYAPWEINTTSLLRYTPPASQDDELALLKERHSYAGRLFTAAADNNAEAQYVLHLMYSDGVLLAYRDHRRASIWYQRAIDNGWLKLAPEKDDISLKCSKHP